MSDSAIEVLEERRTSPVELLWDLVFVFAITQVTTLLWRDLTWAGFGRAMLVLALVWWAWSAFVWAANAQAATSQTLRACLLVSSISIFISGLSIPHAFGSEATLFAATYAIVRFLHLGLYADASRQGNAKWSAIAGFALTVAIGMALLIAGSFASGALRVVLWVLAAAIDYAGPAWLTRERLRGLQRVAVAHFAERYSLFVIICLGESIVAIGVGALGPSAARPLSGALVDAARLALCGGVVLYLLGNAAFALRMVGSVEYEKLAVAVALLVLYAAGVGLAAWALAGALAVLLGGLCASESEAVRRVITHSRGEATRTAG